MKKGLTEVAFIIDKSGSMAGLESDTIGGYNSMLEKQKEVEGECLVTTALFDNGYELLHDRIDIRAVNPITDREYFAGGATALFDAVGRTIQKIGNAQKRTAEEYRADKVIFVIITDGQENSSREYSGAKVKSMIENQKNRWGWEFIFLGANIDAAAEAERLGIDRSRAQNFHRDSTGIEINYRTVARTIASFRETGAMADDWDEEIREDFVKRGGKTGREN